MILYYFNWHLPAYISGVVASDMEIKLENNEQVSLLTCRGLLKPCWNNMESRESVCRSCRFNHKANSVFWQKGIQTIFIDDILSEADLEHAFITSRLMDYNDIEGIKELKHEGMELGYGALSSYISATRIIDPQIDDHFRDYFNRLLKVELAVSIALKQLAERFTINELVIFSGRMHDIRPALYFGSLNKIKTRVLEAIRVSDIYTRKCEFPGVLPQDIDYRFALANKAWKESNLDENQKIEIAQRFFQKRRNNELTQDRIVYTKGQTRGLLPINWDHTKTNIVIFSSSEFEFASLGRLREVMALFKSQIAGIEHISQQVENRKEIALYVRVHPNLTGCSYQYHLELYTLEKKFENLSIIPPDSVVSTYAMIDAMDIGITFGSSTGIESCMSNKPVILLSGCYYYHFKATYNPKNIDELNVLLKQLPLKPKPKIGAYQYAFYLAYPEAYSVDYKYEVKPKKLLGIKFWNVPHLKVYNSQIIYKLIFKLLQYVSVFSRTERKTLIPKVERLELR